MTETASLIRYGIGFGDKNKGRCTNYEGTFEAVYEHICGLAGRYPAPAEDATKEEIRAAKLRAPFICRPMTDGERDEEHTEASRLIFLDVDALTPKAKPQVIAACGLYRCFVYDTASSTAATPKLRAIALTNRDILPEEVAHVTQAFTAALRSKCPDWAEDIDPRSCSMEQFFCLPTDKGVRTAQLFNGAPVDVDAIMREYGAAFASAPTASKAANAGKATHNGGAVREATADELTPCRLPDGFVDPALKALEDKGLIRSAGNQRGQWHIVCPFASEHTTAQGEGDSSTDYFEAGTNGHLLGQFVCLHSHCANRPQDEFFAAIGVDNARYTADLQAIAQTPACLDAMGYTLTNDGVRIYYAKKQADGDAPKVPLCASLNIAARVRDTKGRGWGRLVSFEDDDREQKELIVLDADLQGDTAAVRRRLAGEGLHLFSRAKNAGDLLAAYIYDCPCAKRVRTVSAVGWATPHGLSGRRAYVLPTETITGEAGDAGAESVRYFSEQEGAADWQTHGTAEEWRKAVGAFLPLSRPLTLAVGAALGAPLARLIDLADMTGGFHFYGTAGSGKSAALALAAGVFGAPEKGARLTGWNDTANSLEWQAAANNDGLICLDEASTAGAGMRNKGAALADTVYRLSGGAEKGRLNRQSDARARRQWFCLVLSSGEGALRYFIERADGNADVGLSTRVIDIPVGAPEAGGIFDKAQAGADTKGLCTRLYSAVAKHYGTIGRDWLKYLASRQADMKEMARPWGEAFSKAVGAVPAGQHLRAFRRFQLCAVAFAIACEAGIVNADAGEGAKDIARLYTQWAAAYGEGSQEDARLLERFRDACSQPANFPPFSDFAAGNIGRRVMGFRGSDDSGKDDDDGTFAAPTAGEKAPPVRFFVLSAAFKTLSEGLAVRAVCKTLKTNGILLTGGGRSRQQRRVRGQRLDFYVLDSDALLTDENSQTED